MSVTYTMATVVALTRRHLQASGQLMLTPPNLEAEVRLACRDLAEALKDNVDLRHLIEQDFPVTFTAGSAPIPTTREILRTSLPGARLVIVGMQPFSWYNRKQDMERGSVKFPRWTVLGSAIETRTGDDTSIADGTVGSLRACYVPVVGSSLDDQLVPALIKILAGWWSGAGGGNGGGEEAGAA